jgi:hypothetical protein
VAVDVFVVDGRPRYHLVDCPHLAGREQIPLPVSEAREAGFTPCSLCKPDTTLAAKAREERDKRLASQLTPAAGSRVAGSPAIGSPAAGSPAAGSGTAAESPAASSPAPDAPGADAAGSTTVGSTVAGNQAPAKDQGA